MECHYLNSPTKKKAKTVQPVGRVIGTIFWNWDGCVLLDLTFLNAQKQYMLAVMPRHFTSSFMYCAIKYKHPGKKIILQYNNVQFSSFGHRENRDNEMGSFSASHLQSWHDTLRLLSSLQFSEEIYTRPMQRTMKDIQKAVGQSLLEFHWKGFFKLQIGGKNMCKKWRSVWIKTIHLGFLH